MKSLSLFLVFFFYSFAASAVSFNSSFSLEIKLKDGGSSGEVKFNHPRIKGKEVSSGQAVIHNFLNTSALGSNNLQAISYVCMNEKVVIFNKKI